jgi:23S rRNA (guanine745-N1)-methyltransferase
MVSSRDKFLAAGHYAPLSEVIIATATAAIRPDLGEGGCIADLGAGTAYYLARLLERLPGWGGLALDASRPALRRAARAHERVGAVGCDVWRTLPVRGNAVQLVLDVFAPRNAAEVSRILVPDGAFLVATPNPAHLEPLVSTFGMIGVQENKRERLADSLCPFFVAEHGLDVEFDLALSRDEARALVMMGPSAHHLCRAGLEERLGEAPVPLKARASVRVEIFRKELTAFAEDPSMHGPGRGRRRRRARKVASFGRRG